MIKSSMKPVSTIKWKIFLSNQVNFLIGQKCFPQKLNMRHISPHIVACWYNLQVNPANLINYIFPDCKERRMKIRLQIDQRYGLWLAYKISFFKNKQRKKISTVQLGSENDNWMNKRRRQSSTGQKKKDDTSTDSPYFYLEKSIPYMNF